MTRRQDDESLDELVSDLSTTLTNLQDVLAEEEQDHRRSQQSEQSQRSRRSRQPRRSQRRSRLPSPSRFLRFTEEYTIPTLISLLETNIRALELFAGLLRLINGRNDNQQSDTIPFGGERRVRRTGRRTLGAVDSALSDLQGALEGEPTDSDARSLLDDARSLRGEIDDRLAGSTSNFDSDPDETRENPRSDQNHPDRSDRSNGSDDQGPGEAIRIDVTDEGTDENESNNENQNRNQGSGDAVSIDDELETIKREVQDDAGDDTEDE